MKRDRWRVGFFCLGCAEELDWNSVMDYVGACKRCAARFKQETVQCELRAYRYGRLRLQACWPFFKRERIWKPKEERQVV